MNQELHTIKALFRVVAPDGWRAYSDLTDFETAGGQIGVYRAANWTGNQPYQITIHPPNSIGYHMVEATGYRELPPAFCPWLLIATTHGALSYHLLTKPDVSDGPVLCS